jgi:hypothetical protein
MNEQSWEARAVDEIIALEKRQVELIRLIGDKEGLWLLASELHLILQGLSNRSRN